MTEPKTVTRIAKTRMRHNGRRYQPGDTVELTPAQAAHHERRGHVEPASAPAPSTGGRGRKTEPTPAPANGEPPK
ncbi:hypothetical protein [Roseospira visakhapatnamensis]|uniref:DUF7210 domain-containing protein n=1 Tax=Roseospira visakhapatnamensis TaxID=390880 RepID=A0A7W6RGT8_9PROT|nr:hypothetical protein [Roseospira visakhapatnamensis]MBB4268283.1 hypothetical protein [Roseospira visakhapatnamensis]